LYFGFIYFAQIPLIHIIPNWKGCFEHSKQVFMDRFGSKWSEKALKMPIILHHLTFVSEKSTYLEVLYPINIILFWWEG
jgi:hypothetical protein